MTAPNLFPDWLDRWRLTPDGPAFSTGIGSRLMPVVAEGEPAMLKLASGEEERRGGALMEWWAGDGAARVLARQDNAILLERADGGLSLEAMARDGQDDAAAAILCQVARDLHAPRDRPPPDTLVPLPRWFRQLEPAAAAHGGTFAKSAAAARELLADPREVVVLHGDFHHGNVLDAGERGWIVIDPKGLIGERGFEFANIFHNPCTEVAHAPGRMSRLVGIVAQLAGLQPARLARWILAYSGLSAAWSLESGEVAQAEKALAIAEMAASGLALTSN
jgi:streptomycin 6-kinase